jgi:hypothetical protein
MGLFTKFLTEQGPRIKRVKLRFRDGKPERNIKVSNIDGYKMDYGRSLVRMSSIERIHRHRGALKARNKRRASARHALIQRARTIRRRHAMGL